MKFLKFLKRSLSKNSGKAIKKHFVLPADKKDETHLCVQVIVHGIVQDVYFRSDTKNEAIRIGVCGWVKNLPNGTVQALFEGEKEKVVEIIEWCHRGTKWARVDNVDISWEPYNGEFKHFDQV
ncbi:MAG: acylphosphatase [Nanoarchaeota archaeon]